jgi:hypothetical protein
MVGLLAAVLSGCLLGTINGYTVVVVSPHHGGADEIISAVYGHATVAVCDPAIFGSGYTCVYIVQGNILTSTVDLGSEFGLVGDVFDPVIVQVPSDVLSVTASYSTAGTLVPAVTSIQPLFEYLPLQFISAETGTKFIIMDLPPEVAASIHTTDPVNGPPLDFALTFKQLKPITQTVEPVTVKLMLTAKVRTQGRVYYAPVLPCVTSFASVPTFTIPISNAPGNMLPAFGDIVRNNQAQPCDHESYDYTKRIYNRYLPLAAR